MIRLQLVTLTGTKFDDEVYEVVLPTIEGEIGVMPGHMPLISVATSGVITIRREERDPDSKLEYFATNGGVIEVEGDTLKVLVDEADDAENINQAEAEAAHARALKLKSEAKDQLSLEHAQSMVDRTATRLHVANLRQRHRRH